MQRVLVWLCVLAAGIQAWGLSYYIIPSQDLVRVVEQSRYPDVVWMRNYQENYEACNSALMLMAPRVTEQEVPELIARYNACLVQMKVAI